MKAIVDTKEISIGDVVNFKLDTEQRGKVIDIYLSDSDCCLTVEGDFDGILSGEDSFSVETSRCWLDRGYKTILEKTKRKKTLKNKITTIVDGKSVTIGDVVSFKCDEEQTGVIKDIIKGDTVSLVLRAPSDEGFSGGYIGGNMETTEEASRCWVEK